MAQYAQFDFISYTSSARLGLRRYVQTSSSGMMAAAGTPICEHASSSRLSAAPIRNGVRLPCVRNESTAGAHESRPNLELARGRAWFDCAAPRLHS